jgi:uncharacterized protein
MRSHICLLILLFPVCTLAQLDQSAEIKHYRDSINEHFANPETTILEEQFQADFKGLDFFPNSSAFVVKAKFKPIENGQEFEMKTSTERLPVYRPYGKLMFEIAGEKLELTAYQNVKYVQTEEGKHHLFVPFTDETNGDETYGGGRYLDLDLRKITDKTMIDFNKCYNPYCAYNGKFSCPVPPRENTLKVRIEAGVKAYADH